MCVPSNLPVWSVLMTLTLTPCKEVAVCLGINAETVFWCDRGNRKPVIAVWTEGWTDSDLARSMKLKTKVKVIADRYGAKIYMTKTHPQEKEIWELTIRKGQGRRYRVRHGYKVNGNRTHWREDEWERQKGFCLWCNEHVPKENATLEHIVPLGKGGSVEPSNLGMACSPCNGSRHKWPMIVTFWKLLKFRLRLKFR